MGGCGISFFFLFFLQRKDCTSVGEQQLQVLGFFFFFFPPFYSVDLSSNFCEPIAKTCQFRRLCELKGGKIGETSLAKAMVCWNCRRRFNRQILVR